MTRKRAEHTQQATRRRANSDTLATGAKLVDKQKSRATNGRPPDRWSEETVAVRGGTRMSRSTKRQMTQEKKQRQRTPETTQTKIEAGRSETAVARAMTLDLSGPQLGGRLSQDVSEYKRESFQQLDRLFKERKWLDRVKRY